MVLKKSFFHSGLMSEKMIRTDQIKKAIRLTMDIAGKVEQSMMQSRGRAKSRLKHLFFKLVKLRADMINAEDEFKRARHPEEWK